MCLVKHVEGPVLERGGTLQSSLCLICLSLSHFFFAPFYSKFYLNQNTHILHPLFFSITVKTSKLHNQLVQQQLILKHRQKEEKAEHPPHVTLLQ